MTRVCVVGSINADLTFSVEALPGPGETVLASSLATAPGGKGANQAIAAARAGDNVDFVGAVGSDPVADQLLSHLRANDVDTAAVTRVPGPSGTAVVVVDANAENAIVVAPGANAHLTMDSAAARDAVAAADVLLLQLEIPIATAVAAARVARGTGTTVIVNASPAAPESTEFAELAGLADVVVVNEAEATHWPWQVRHLVVTRGAQGASYRGTDGEIDVAAPAVEAVDTTGAGDVFAGVLAAGWTGGRDRAMRRACAAAALSTLIAGAGDCAPRDEAIEDALVTD